jgi:UV excision repair protein RAD23
MSTPHVLKAVSTPALSDTTDITMPDTPPLTVTLSTPTPAPVGTGDRPVVSAPRRHTRIPSVVRSPSPSAESPSASVTDITPILDADGDGGGLPSKEISAYHVALAEPAFWERLLEFLK